MKPRASVAMPAPVEAEVVGVRARGRRRAAGGSRDELIRAARPCSAMRTPAPSRRDARIAHSAFSERRRPSRSRILRTSADTSSSSRAISAVGASRRTVTSDAEAPVHLRELEADVAAADDDQVLAAGSRSSIIDELVSTGTSVQARPVGQRRASADVDEDLRRLELAGRRPRRRAAPTKRAWPRDRARRPSCRAATWSDALDRLRDNVDPCAP